MARPIRGGTAFGGKPRYSGGDTAGSGTTKDPYRKKRSSGGSRRRSTSKPQEETKPKPNLKLPEKRITDEVTVRPVQYYVGDTPVSPTTIYKLGQVQDKQRRYARGQQFRTAREKGQYLTTGEASFVTGGSGEVTDRGTPIGGTSVPYSSFSGEGKEYTSYVITKDATPRPEAEVSSQLRKATRRERASEKLRQAFRPNEQQIVRDGYVIREPRRGTVVNPQGGALRDRPALANTIRERGLSTSQGGSFYVGRGSGNMEPNYIDITTGRPSRTSYGQRYGTELIASTVESPERTILQTTGGYAVGNFAGQLTSRGVQATSALTASRFGIQAGIRTATATSTALTVGGTAVGVGLASQATPEEMARATPSIVGFGAGYARGYGRTASVQERSQTTTDYLGLRQSLPEATPKQTAYSQGGRIVATATSNKGAVFDVFGKPTTGNIRSSTTFTGVESVQGKGMQRYTGRLYSERIATIPDATGGYTVGRSVRGYGVLNPGEGVAVQQYPGTTAVSVVTATTPTSTRSVMLQRTNGQYTTQQFRTSNFQPIQAEITSTGRKTFIEGKNILQAEQTTRNTQTYNFLTGTQTKQQPATPRQANQILEIAGFERPAGVTARSRATPRGLYSVPGFAPTTIQTMRATQQTGGITRTTPKTVQQIPPIGAGTGVGRIRAGTTTGAMFAGTTGVTTAQFLQPTTKQNTNLRTNTFEGLNFGAGTGINSRYAQNTTNRQIQGLFTSQSGTFDQATTSRTSFVPFNPTGTPPPPPPIIPLGGLTPTFGIGTGTRKTTKSKGRSFQYAPSLQASLFGLEGKQTNTLTGLEIRPTTKKRRKKKK